jgi:hypothetical protein
MKVSSLSGFALSIVGFSPHSAVAQLLSNTPKQGLVRVRGGEYGSGGRHRAMVEDLESYSLLYVETGDYALDSQGATSAHTSSTSSASKTNKASKSGKAVKVSEDCVIDADFGCIDHFSHYLMKRLLMIRIVLHACSNIPRLYAT